MQSNNSLIPKKEGFLFKIISKIKRIFNRNHYKKEHSLEENIKNDDVKRQFITNLKIAIDNEIYSLKFKLESGEVKAVELTDEQIDKLQEIYNAEILQKQRKLDELKKSA